MMRLEWQKPTDWSRETVDGAYYMELDETSGEWTAWRRMERLGRYPSEDAAKTACEEHAGRA
jgi:hypothetical protein